jgi:hypothetical protein
MPDEITTMINSAATAFKYQLTPSRQLERFGLSPPTRALTLN